jgi:drug/metabolite transporter (DMT)-like permease
VTWAAFVGLIVLVAGNVVAVRMVNQELAPYWGAGTRFVGASFLFFGLTALRRQSLPRGRALVGTVLYGLMQFSLAFAFAYQALREVPAGLASVILASTPLFTLFFAFLFRLEPLRWRAVLGALVAVAGIAVMAGARAGGDIPLLYLALAVAAAICFALSGIVVKLFQPAAPEATNAVAMLIGAIILLGLSWAFDEPAVVPTEPATWAAQLYLVVPGSVGLFGLLLYLLSRWTASAVSFQSVLSPPVAIALSWWLLGEQPSSGLFLGGALVLIGVYFGAIAPRAGHAPE